MNIDPEKKKKYLNILGLLAILVIIIYGIAFLLWANTLDIYHSPEKQTTIGIDYDFFGHPVIFQKEGFAWRKVWEYNGPDFVEDSAAYWLLQWEDERSITLSYHDGTHQDASYHILLPEKMHRPTSDIDGEKEP